MLNATAVSKSFFSNKVLDAVDIDVRSGEVHGLVGENGAGKSTLINIIGGILQRDFGLDRLRRPRSRFHPSSGGDGGGRQRRPSGAQSGPERHGHREHFSCAARSETRSGSTTGAQWPGPRGPFSREWESTSIRTLWPGSLSVGMQQLVEVAKAISIDAKLLIMDEPTSSLSEKEVGRALQGHP